MRKPTLSYGIIIAVGIVTVAYIFSPSSFLPQLVQTVEAQQQGTIWDDPEMRNLLEISTDCTQRMSYGNESITHAQCMEAFGQASDKYCGIVAYDSNKCNVISIMGSSYQSTYNIIGEDYHPLAEEVAIANATSNATLTITNGSAVQGNPGYDPDPLTVPAGSVVIVTNQDTRVHTVTSGTGPTDPNPGQLFDAGLINGGESATLSLAGVAAGQYDYYCMLHPHKTGTLVVQ